MRNRRYSDRVRQARREQLAQLVAIAIIVTLVAVPIIIFGVGGAV